MPIPPRRYGPRPKLHVIDEQRGGELTRRLAKYRQDGWTLQEIWVQLRNENIHVCLETVRRFCREIAA